MRESDTTPYIFRIYKWKVLVLHHACERSISYIDGRYFPLFLFREMRPKRKQQGYDRRVTSCYCQMQCYRGMAQMVNKKVGEKGGGGVTSVVGHIFSLNIYWCVITMIRLLFF